MVLGPSSTAPVQELVSTFDCAQVESWETIEIETEPTFDSNAGDDYSVEDDRVPRKSSPFWGERLSFHLFKVVPTFKVEGNYIITTHKHSLVFM